MLALLVDVDELSGRNGARLNDGVRIKIRVCIQQAVGIHPGNNHRAVVVIIT